MKNIAILILAAGNSSRMGSIKQLLPWKEATLIDNAIVQAKASHAVEVVAVLGAHSKKIKKNREAHGIVFLENKNWESGLGTSIACGIHYIRNIKNKIDGVLVMLADQPLINTTYLNEMMLCFAENPKHIIATNYKNRAGVPAIFSPDYFPELAALNDDFGAKIILKKYKNRLFELETCGKTDDIDSPEDYDRLKNSSL